MKILADIPRKAPLTLYPSMPTPFSSAVHFPIPDEFSQSVASSVNIISTRDYALLELLRSERTYTSSLVCIRDYQIPLASGRLESVHSLLPTVEWTVCQYLGLEPTSSHASGPSTAAPVLPIVASQTSMSATNVSSISLDSIFTLCPMKTRDVHLVFSNIKELAEFSERFLDQLESSMGRLIEGSVGEDDIGKLFLQSIPEMEPLYTTYIMKQNLALEHYHRLSTTFQFDVYLPLSQILAHKSSNAWDLPSLLIKPVQRLLHYPQLLATIIAETPNSHHDKANLMEAHARIAAVARGLNARWKQKTVVLEVLKSVEHTGIPQIGNGAKKMTMTWKKSRLKLALAGSVTLGCITTPRLAACRSRLAGITVKEPEEHSDAKAVKAMGQRVRNYIAFMAQFMDEVVDWGDAMQSFIGALEEWMKGFERVVWLHIGTAHSETFEAFRTLVSNQWLPLCDKLKTEIKEDILPGVVRLMKTSEVPMWLLETMETLKPLHHQLLNHTATNSHAPSQLSEASERYVALCAQLFSDLPTYLALLDKGVTTCILKFSHVQRWFYKSVRDMWAELWHRVKGDEPNEGVDETLQTWRHQFSKADQRLMCLNILSILSGIPRTS